VPVAWRVRAACPAAPMMPGPVPAAVRIGPAAAWRADLQRFCRAGGGAAATSEPPDRPAGLSTACLLTTRRENWPRCPVLRCRARISRPPRRPVAAGRAQDIAFELPAWASRSPSGSSGARPWPPPRVRTYPRPRVPARQALHSALPCAGVPVKSATPAAAVDTSLHSADQGHVASGRGGLLDVVRHRPTCETAR